MIVKKVSIPIRATQIGAVLKRLSLDHPKYSVLESELRGRMSGYHGEQSVSTILEVLPEKEYFIFHDIRLPGKHYHFQMDFLILSSCFFLILEVKNITGDLILMMTLSSLFVLTMIKPMHLMTPLFKFIFSVNNYRIGY